MKQKLQSILVIKLRYLGDVLLTTPVFDALRFNYPDAFIAACVNKGTEEMLTGHPAINKIYTLEKDRNLFSSWSKQMALFSEIRKERYDLALELTRNDRGAFLAFVSGASKRLGFASPQPKLFGRHLFYTDLIVPRMEIHMVERQLQMIEHLGLAIPKKAPSLYWSSENEEKVMGILASVRIRPGEPYVVLHPILRSRYKAWHKEGYAALCDHLEDKWHLRTILVCGREAGEVRFADQILPLCQKSRPIHLGGRLSLKELAVVISRAALYIGIDSGPMHMAAALKTPLIAIFGSQRKEHWGPYGKDQTVVQKPWACVPCTLAGCDDKGIRSRCLDELTSEEMIAVLDRKMARLVQDREGMLQ